MTPIPPQMPVWGDKRGGKGTETKDDENDEEEEIGQK